ncbi:MAG: hypothetical protein HQ495_09045 [Alphaproteobacteria bacterium]|nr:hypothetical protein [Alphaproteobacteria bacterium]
MAGHLRVQLLGGFHLQTGDRPLEGFGTRRTRSLFAYLLLNRGRMFARELLAEKTVAPEAPDPLKALRQELWNIRSALKKADVEPTFIVADSDVVGAREHDDALMLDVDAFVTSLSQAPRSDELTEQHVNSLEEATTLYGGDLLAGATDDWILVERELLRDRYLGALDRLMVHYLRQEAWSHALRAGKRLLAEDPLAEYVHRNLMRAYYAMGHRAAALRQYQTCRRLLRNELEVEPMPETQDLHYLVRTERPASADRAPKHAPGVPSVGRTVNELIRAGDAIAAAIESLSAKDDS